MANSSVREFDIKLIGQIILNEKLMNANSVEDLIQTPEFNVLKVIGENDGLENDEITSRYEPPYSVSMILSNLSADGLIVQTSDYKWLLSDKFINLINSKKGNTIVNSSQNDSKKWDNENIGHNVLPQVKKKQNFKKFADVLSKMSFIPKFYTYIEDLYEIPELQLLIIIRDNQPVSTSDLETLFTHPESSVSLTLSNLKADGIIEETKEYLWKISEDVETKLKDYENKFDISGLDAKEVENIKEDDPLKQINLVEQMQLIKSLLDISYFKDQPVKEILLTPEFKLLSLINTRSPISQEEIEEILNIDTSLSMLLSNLKIDSLIEQLNDYRWELSDDFRQRIAQVKISKEDFIEELRKRDQLKLPNQNSASLLPQNEKKMGESAKNVMRDILSKPEMKGMDPILAALIKFKYLSNPNLNLSELHSIPEYEILSQLRNNKILSLEEIEDLTHITSLSMYLSNLRSDNLIDQTNDYRWTLGPELVDTTAEDFNQSKQKTIKSDFTHDKISLTLDKDKENKAIYYAINKKGYINPDAVSIADLNKIPEYEVIKILIESKQIDVPQLKTKITSLSPVHVSRLISKLVADNVIIVQNEKISLTENFVELLKEQDKLMMEKDNTEELLREQQKQEEERQRIQEEERQHILEEERQRIREEERKRIQEEEKQRIQEEEEKKRIQEEERKRIQEEERQRIREEERKRLQEEEEKKRIQEEERQRIQEEEKKRIQEEEEKKRKQEEERLRIQEEERLRIQEEERQRIREEERKRIQEEERQRIQEEERKRKEEEEKKNLEVKFADDDWSKLKYILKKIDYIDFDSEPNADLDNMPEYIILKLILNNGKMNGEEIRSNLNNFDPVQVTKTLNKLQFEAIIEKNLGIYSISRMILKKIKEL